LARCQARGRPACVAAGGGRAPAHLREPGPFFFDFSCLCPGRLGWAEVRSQRYGVRLPSAALALPPRVREVSRVSSPRRSCVRKQSRAAVAQDVPSRVRRRRKIREVQSQGTESDSPPPLSLAEPTAPPRTDPPGYGVRLPSAALALPPRVREVSRVSSPRRSSVRKQSRAAVARDVPSRVRRRRKIRGWFVRSVPPRRVLHRTSLAVARRRRGAELQEGTTGDRGPPEDLLAATPECSPPGGTQGGA